MDNLPRTPAEYRRWWSENTNVPYGYCWCGCGARTTKAPKNTATRRMVKGEPRRFLPTHGARSLSPAYIKEDRGHDTPCWVWQRSLGLQGYARTTRNYRTLRAARVYYEDAKGAIPAGFEIDHLCKVVACVNPDHLEAVTAKENVRRSSTAKLTATQIEEIRCLLLEGEVHAAIARRYGVARATVGDIWTGKSWL